jgi:hypothetical protein
MEKHNCTFVEAAECTIDHPFAFDGSMKCCMHRWKTDNLALDTDCNGGEIDMKSSGKCCLNEDFVDCPDTNAGCKDLKMGKTMYINY